MIWKAVTLFGLALCAQGERHATSEQMIKQEFGLHGHHGGLHHIGSHMPEHHEGYAWAYPSYEFSYSVNDPHTHDYKGQREHRLGDEVKGEYWLLQPDGKKRTVKYQSDKQKGFKAEVHYSEHHHKLEEPRIEAIIKPVVEIVTEEPERPIEESEPVILEEIPVVIEEKREEERIEPKYYKPKHSKPIHIEYYVNHKYRNHQHEELEKQHEPERVEAEERREEERREEQRREEERREEERRLENQREEERREEERREKERREEERREEERREEKRREEERREEKRREEEAAEAARLKEEKERRKEIKHRKPVHIEYFSNIHHPIHNEHHGYEIPRHHYYKHVEVEERKEEQKPIRVEEIGAERRHEPHVQLLRMHKPLMFRPERARHSRYNRDHSKQNKGQ